MDAPPVNKLLQLLRQKPPEPPDESPAAQTASPRPKRRPSPVPRSGIQHAPNNSVQTATNDVQCATLRGLEIPSDGIPCAPQNKRQPATSGIQSVTDRSIPGPPKSSTRYAGGSDITLPTLSLSKGQRRVLQFLLANRDPFDPSQTVLIGYHAISTYCFLSRN